MSRSRHRVRRCVLHGLFFRRALFLLPGRMSSSLQAQAVRTPYLSLIPMKTLTLVLTYLLVTTSLLAAPLLNTPELHLTPGLTLDAVAVGSSSATIASNGTDFLMAWVESRGT